MAQRGGGEQDGVKMNFVLSLVALVIAVVACVLAVQLVFFQPAPLSEKRISAMVEEKTKTYITEERAREIVEGAIAVLKPAVPGEGEE